MTLDLADRNPRSVHRVATALEQMRFFDGDPHWCPRRVLVVSCKDSDPDNHNSKLQPALKARIEIRQSLTTTILKLHRKSIPSH